MVDHLTPLGASYLRLLSRSRTPTLVDKVVDMFVAKQQTNERMARAIANYEALLVKCLRGCTKPAPAAIALIAKLRASSELCDASTWILRAMHAEASADAERDNAELDDMVIYPRFWERSPLACVCCCEKSRAKHAKLPKKYAIEPPLDEDGFVVVDASAAPPAYDDKSAEPARGAEPVASTPPAYAEAGAAPTRTVATNTPPAYEEAGAGGLRRRTAHNPETE